MTRAITRLPEPLVSFTVPLSPVPASRPRVARNGAVYYTKTYSRYYRDLQAFLRSVPLPATSFAGRIAISVEIVQPPFKTVSREFSRSDLDNLVKPILDAITKTEKVWDDDSQIVYLQAFKRFARSTEKPHTRFAAYTLGENDDASRAVEAALQALPNDHHV